MRIERLVTSISWIPSDSIPGLMRLPFARGIMHYDPPPPLTLSDVDAMRRRGEFRFANQLRAYIEVENGRITGCGYTGGVVGPGSVVGERAPLEAGRRTADLRATTPARVAHVPADRFDLEVLSELAQGHHREDIT